MNRAIKCLTDRAQQINDEIHKLNESMKEPEMNFEIFFAENAIENLKDELTELQKATMILLKRTKCKSKH